MSKTLLSYSSLNNLHLASHTWINHVMGIKSEETFYMSEGKKAHEVIQKHISGKEKIPDFKLDLEFPTIEYHCQSDYNDKYRLHSYVDGVDFASKTFCEIKTVNSKVWGQSDFEKSVQPIYYSFVTKLKKAFFITCKFDLSNLKIYYQEFTEKDWQKAKEWIDSGISIIEKGDFTGGLIDGKCQGCSYGSNCWFK